MGKRAAVLLAAALLLAAAVLDVSGVAGRSVLLDSSEAADVKANLAFGSMNALEKEAASFSSGSASPISSAKALRRYDAAFGRLQALKKFADDSSQRGEMTRRDRKPQRGLAPAPVSAERHRAARGGSVQPTFKPLVPFNEGVVMPPGGAPETSGNLDAGRSLNSQKRLPPAQARMDSTQDP